MAAPVRRAQLSIRLDAVLSAAVALAVVTPFLTAAWIARELRNPFNRQYLPPVERIFAHGPPRNVAEIALASVVLLLMVPASTPFARKRAITRLVLIATLTANLVLVAGYAWTASTWENFGRATWDPPTGMAFVLDQLPTTALSVVLLWILVQMARWRRDAGRAKAEPEPDPAEAD
jgi:hypothetical protein